MIASIRKVLADAREITGEPAHIDFLKCATAFVLFMDLMVLLGGLAQ